MFAFYLSVRLGGSVKAADLINNNGGCRATPGSTGSANYLNIKLIALAKDSMFPLAVNTFLTLPGIGRAGKAD